MKSLSLLQQHAIVMVGIPGSGKSHFAKKFSDTFNIPIVDIASIAAHSADDVAASELIFIIIDELLKTKQSIIIDAGSASHKERLEFNKYLAKHHYEPLVVWVQTEYDIAKQRALRGGKSEPFFENEFDHFDAPQPNEKPLVISGRHTYASQVKTVLKRLTAARAAVASEVKPKRPGSVTVR